MDELNLLNFSLINLNDPFFDSLKNDYHEFIDWFQKKANANEKAYVLYNTLGTIDGFLYLKEEHDVLDISHPIKNKKILKIGTFKFNPKGTLRGQRFIKKILDIAIIDNYDVVYLTVFEKHDYLIKLFKKYGFIQISTKNTKNGIECVYSRDLSKISHDILLDYPLINTKSNKFLLAIYPKFHTRLFPESKLKNEPSDLIQDVSHSNSIHKIYISAAYNADQLKKGDILIIYRTSDNPGKAYYHAVISSICVVEEVKNIDDFPTLQEYLDYCEKFSVFTKDELSKFYKERKYPYIIRFTYNIALPKRIVRKDLLREGLITQGRIVLNPISDDTFNSILKLSTVYENFIIN